jgi:hypothetical protein
MRTLLAGVLLLLVAPIAAAGDAPDALSIAIEPLGDHAPGVVARLYFRFANPRAVTVSITGRSQSRLPASAPSSQSKIPRRIRQ